MGSRRPDTNLVKTIALLYEMQDADERELAKELEESMKRSYRESIEAQAARLGFQVTANNPRQSDLREIRAKAADAAASIRNTWNKNVRNEIRRLFAANPRGNRNYYFSNLERWASARSEWKDIQIALDNDGFASALGNSSFSQNNGLDPTWRLDGPPPREEICAGLMAQGVVSDDVKRRNEAPIHLNCPHEWVMVSAAGINEVSELWVG